jgi:L-ascorbate metabolism protein UlaG (beta-lactamase superfamily)
MVPFESRQQEIERRRVELAAAYPRLWERMIAAWSARAQADRAWLTYSANYLLCTAGVRWAIDPFTLHSRLPAAPQVDELPALRGLAFVVLTHAHSDHLDLSLIRALRDEPIQWVVPEPLLPIVSAGAGLPRDRIVVPHPGEPLPLHGIRLLPFNGLHDENTPERQKAVPALGYAVEFNRKRWVFPGDTRTYAAGRLPAIEGCDGVFAHVWLGRNAALADDPPLLDAFCDFHLSLRPERLVLAHLEELGRGPDEFWGAAHVSLVQQRCRFKAPRLSVEAAYMGEGVTL